MGEDGEARGVMSRAERKLRRRFAEVIAVCLVSITVDDELRDFLLRVAQEEGLAKVEEQRG